MKLTSKPLVKLAQYFKRRNVTQAAVYVASLYGVNEIFGVVFTAKLLMPEVKKLLRALAVTVKNQVRRSQDGERGKRNTTNGKN